MKTLALLALSLSVIGNPWGNPWGSPARADEFLLTPIGAQANDSRLRSAIQAVLPAARVESVFSEDEKNAILQMGDSSLGSSVKVTLPRVGDEKTLRRIARSQGWKADLRSEGAKLQEESGTSLEDLQWGLHNRGEPKRLLVSDTTSAQIPGLAGEDIGVDRAPPLASGAPVVVAVLDTGLDSSHPALATRIYKSPIAPGDSMVGDPMTDEIGHGTHVAGIIAATGAAGVRGVFPGALLLPVKVIKRAPNAPIRPQAQGAASDGRGDGPGGAFADTIARGLLYAARSGAKIANLSLAWPLAADSLLMRKTVALAQAQGMLIVAAAGNDSTQALDFPCAYDGVICVGAHGPDGALSHFSNFGSHVELAAPGLSILSTYPLKRDPVNFTAAQGYEMKNGTSMAAPFVAGALARLLAQGMSPNEARARLLAGARPGAEPSWENPAFLAQARKWVSFGNADLGRAMSLSPRPLFERASKAATELELTPGARALPLTLRVRNSWARSAEPVEIVARVLPFEGESPVSATLETSKWIIGSWESGETRTLSSRLLLPQSLSSVDSRALVELTFSRKSGLVQSLRIPLKLVRKIDGNALPEGALAFSLPSQVPSGSSFRTVLARDGKPDLEYLAFNQAGDSLAISRLLHTESGLSLVSQGTIPAPQGSLYVVDRLPGSRVALVVNVPGATPGALPSYEIQILSPSLAVERVIRHDNGVAALPDRYRWLRTSGDSKLVFPAWIGRGTTPPLEKKPFDPWDPKPADDPVIRFYFLSPEGIRSMAAPDGYDWVSILESTSEDLSLGRVRALVQKGTEYQVNFATVTILDGQVSAPEPLSLTQFRALDSTPQVGKIQALEPGFEGQYFGGESTVASVRATLVFSGAFSGAGQASQDIVQSPVARFDSAMSLIGVFASSRGNSTFVETHSSLQYADHLTGEVALTDLGRYSFIAPLVFSSGFSPVFGWDAASRQRLPAIFVPSELGAPDGFEVIEPQRDPRGKRILTRPASLHWSLSDSAEGTCEQIGNPIEIPGQASRVAFVCGSRWLEIPLTN